MTENPDLPMFTKLVGQEFEIALDASGPLILKLIEATGLESNTARPDGQPFTLVFRGPTDVELPQGTYDLRNDSLGQVAIFLVPFRQDEEGRFYEAVFN